MATLNIKIENGFFVGTNGCYVSVVEPTHVVANGWNCLIEEDGTIKCVAIRDYSDGEHSMHYVIHKNGYSKLTLKVPNNRVKTLRKGYVVPKGTMLSDGLIGLAGGHIDDRYAYFRDASFQKFLEEHGISAVKHEDPNKKFTIRNARYGGGECQSYLLTDGKTSREGYDSGRSDSWEEDWPGTCAYEGNEYLKVTGATWAIHKQSQHEGNSHNYFRILYTLERDLTKLVGIPNIKENMEKISRLREIGSKGFLSIAELENALCEVVPALRKGVKAPEIIEVKRVDFYFSWKLETNDMESIWFPDSKRAEEALEKLRGVKFDTPQMLEKYLVENGFPDAEMTRYYAFVTTNDEKTKVYIEMRPSTSRGKGFDGFSRNYWTAEI